MQKIILCISVIILTVLSCSRKCSDITNPDEKGDIPIAFSIRPALDNGFEVTRVKATIIRDDFSDYLNLEIVGDSASGTFYNLEPGLYQVQIEVFENEVLIANGYGEGEVIAGETTIVHIILEFVNLTGNLEIIVTWESDYMPPGRILFVGNSYTYYNGGINSHLRNLVSAAHPESEIETDNVTFGGFTLENHFNSAITLDQIQTGDWDYVVLQEQSALPVSEPDLMYEFADSLDSVITGSGSNTAFFMTWAREYDPPMIEDLAVAYNYIGGKLNAPVSPVGRAFQRALETQSEINLYALDQSHPSSYGTYLAACLFYAVFWHESPVGIEYSIDENMTDEDREFLQFIAWETYILYYR